MIKKNVIQVKQIVGLKPIMLRDDLCAKTLEDVVKVRGSLS